MSTIDLAVGDIGASLGPAPSCGCAIESVSLIDLHTARPRRPSLACASHLQPGDMVGMFRAFARSGEEILIGADDRHLDFRASMLVRRDASRSSAVLTTVVHFNSLGRPYFFVVRPFHRLIVTSLLRHVTYWL